MTLHPPGDVKTRATREEIAAARTRKQLNTLAIRYGYSDAWVDRVIKARNRKNATRTLNHL